MALTASSQDDNRSVGGQGLRGSRQLGKKSQKTQKTRQKQQQQQQQQQVRVGRLECAPVADEYFMAFEIYSETRPGGCTVEPTNQTGFPIHTHTHSVRDTHNAAIISTLGRRRSSPRKRDGLFVVVVVVVGDHVDAAGPYANGGQRIGDGFAVGLRKKKDKRKKGRIFESAGGRK